MTEEKLNKSYFDWMYQLVNRDDSPDRRELLKQLHETDFTYLLSMDGNRAEDGIALRYRFGREIDCSDVEIAAYLDNRPCSVFEMMVALALHCEEQVVGSSEDRDRLSKWLDDMLKSLGLDDITDENYIDTSRQRVEAVIQRFLNREYLPNGKGGLFTTSDDHRDMRMLEIWHQACIYMNEKEKEWW